MRDSHGFPSGSSARVSSQGIRKRSEIAAIVLAAGKRTRMTSALPKVLHRIAGRSMVGHVLDNLAALKVTKTAVVIAPGMDSVAKEVVPHAVAIQQEQLGTAH